jgi:hypothetical protein
MRVHSVLPAPLADTVDDVLAAAGVAHVRHAGHVMRAAEAAAGDEDALALIGPFRSADVSEALAATAPQGLPLLAPAATWAGVTRDDEPGCDDAPDHRGTVLRIVARDTEVAARIASDVANAGVRAYVVAGEHEYGMQLDGQLRIGALPRARMPAEADLVVLCGLAGEPEMTEAAGLAPTPVVAFDGVQGGERAPGQMMHVALPIAPHEVAGGPEFGVPQARRAAELVVAALAGGAATRPAVLAALRELGPFDEHGDPLHAPVWLWRADERWRLVPERELPPVL